ncbi:hypothetical protein [Micromonospora sp. NPDC023737]|uniref:hypothetical protein n=1 Tax=unclassified Micromonospora TaxID=2617518 RepID=UPI0033D68E41
MRAAARSVRIDGAGWFRLFWRVVPPLCTAALAASTLFTFTHAWEGFLRPLIVLACSGEYTAPLGLALFVVKNRTSWNLPTAGSAVAALPMIVAFPVFQRRFVQGTLMRGLKG